MEIIPKLSEILKENIEFKKQNVGEPCRVCVLSNIVVHYIKDYLFNILYKNGINITINLGDYDTIVQNTWDGSIKNDDIVVIFFELANLIEGFHYKIQLFTEEEYKNILNEVKDKIDLILNNLQGQPLVIFNKFNAEAFKLFDTRNNKFISIVDELNNYLEQTKMRNIHFVEISRIFEKLSVDLSINLRDYYSSKALYTSTFFFAYSEMISPVIKSLKGKSKKALIFDCDNTLWNGVIGEDGIDGIKMTANQKMQPYEEVQYYAKYLSSRGILIGLCSKNNPDDVDRVINEHPDFKIKNEEFVIKVVNWNDKASNLRYISETLNIGLDSIVFVDDSDFEINLINEQLPSIVTIQVPTSEIHKYPSLIRNAFSLFFNINETTEDRKKIQMYKTNEFRKHEMKKFDNLEDYLSSLDMKMNVFINEKSLIPRMAQMTQKTNQFNLTTIRYSEQEIDNFIKVGNSVLSFSVSDKFGESGVTGFAIISYTGDTAYIDSLLMSCRILGRNIEYKFLDMIFEHIKSKGKSKICAKYIRTQKNNQVSDFYEKFGFEIIAKDDNCKIYEICSNNYIENKINYIKMSIND